MNGRMVGVCRFLFLHSRNYLFTNLQLLKTAVSSREICKNMVKMPLIPYCIKRKCLKMYKLHYLI